MEIKSVKSTTLTQGDVIELIKNDFATKAQVPYSSVEVDIKFREADKGPKDPFDYSGYSPTKIKSVEVWSNWQQTNVVSRS
jgi:hypothetical protein